MPPHQPSPENCTLPKPNRYRLGIITARCADPECGEEFVLVTPSRSMHPDAPIEWKSMSYFSLNGEK